MQYFFAEIPFKVSFIINKFIANPNIIGLFEGYNYDFSNASTTPITSASTNQANSYSNQTGKSFEKQLSLDMNQQFTDKDEDQ